MIVWRIIRDTYVESAFGGLGAADYPGRWNHRGRRIAYASDSPALAMLEILANADTSAALRDRVNVRATFPDECMLVLPNEDLPQDWQRDPPPSSTRDLGEAWRLRGDSLALSIPSAAMPLQRNVLIDPEHPDFHTLKVDAPIPLMFDPRLMEFTWRAHR